MQLQSQSTAPQSVPSDDTGDKLVGRHPMQLQSQQPRNHWFTCRRHARQERNRN